MKVSLGIVIEPSAQVWVVKSILSSIGSKLIGSKFTGADVMLGLASPPAELARGLLVEPYILLLLLRANSGKSCLIGSSFGTLLEPTDRDCERGEKGSPAKIRCGTLDDGCEADKGHAVP